MLDPIRSFKFKLLFIFLQLLGFPCPDQRLTAQSYPQSNTSDITNHPELVIMSSGDIVYSITTDIERKQHYTATISLIGIEGIIQELNLTFSEFYTRCYFGVANTTQVRLLFKTVMYPVTSTLAPY